MKIQVALDFGTLEENIALMHKVETEAEIIEMGTPLIFHYGTAGLARLRKEFPDHQILFDGKIVDAGCEESQLAFDNGADIVTLLATAHDETIKTAVQFAHSIGKEVFVDLLGTEDLAKRTKELLAMNIDYVGIHIAHDVQNVRNDPTREFKLLDGVIDSRQVAIAGGLNPERVKVIAPYRPGIVIIGTALAAAKDPKAMLHEIRNNLEV